MKSRNLIKSGIVTAVLMIGAGVFAAASGGCIASSPDVGSEAIGINESELVLNTVAPATNACWDTAGFATEKAWVQDQIAKTWEAAGNVKFNWSSAPCAAGTSKIQFKDEVEAPHYRNGVMVLNPNFMKWPDPNRVTPPTAQQRESEVRGIAVHEFGHMLGYGHEHDRADEPFSGVVDCPNADGTWFAGMYTPYDSQSVMSYCSPRRPPDATGFDRNPNETLSWGDKDGIVRKFGFPVDSAFSGNWCGAASNKMFSGDFNKDGKIDLLCRSSNHVWIDYGGSFDGTEWELNTSFCPNMDIYVGDFNGDQRDDLLCRGATTLAVDFADTNGRFAAAVNGDSSTVTDWCNHPEAGNRIYVGDFNGNSTDDVLCKGTNDMWVEYDNVPTLQNDWHLATTWCDISNNLRVGKFDANASDDLLCHRPSDGRIWIDQASNGQFNGSNWDGGTANSFCSGSNRQLLVGNLDGDSSGRDDLLCNTIPSGFKEIKFNGLNGTFFTKFVPAAGDTSGARGEWSGDFAAWCGASTNRLMLGKLDADARVDLVCQDGTSGLRWTMITPQFDPISVTYNGAIHSEERAAPVIVAACQGHMKANDGCDCGCGARDLDCPNDSAAACQYVSCSGTRVSLAVTPGERTKVVGAVAQSSTKHNETNESMSCY